MQSAPPPGGQGRSFPEPRGTIRCCPHPTCDLRHPCPRWNRPSCFRRATWLSPTPNSTPESVARLGRNGVPRRAYGKRGSPYGTFERRGETARALPGRRNVDVECSQSQPENMLTDWAVAHTKELRARVDLEPNAASVERQMWRTGPTNDGDRCRIGVCGTHARDHERRSRAKPRRFGAPMPERYGPRAGLRRSGPRPRHRGPRRTTAGPRGPQERRKPRKAGPSNQWAILGSNQ